MSEPTRNVVATIADINVDQLEYFGVGDLVTVRDLYRSRGAKADDLYRIVAMPDGRRTSVKVENVRTGVPVSGPVAAFQRHTGPVPDLPAPLPVLHPGALVEVEEGHRIPTDVQYVVLGTAADGSVKLAKLGGDGGRFWTKIPRSYLTLLEV